MHSGIVYHFEEGLAVQAHIESIIGLDDFAFEKYVQQRQALVTEYAVVRTRINSCDVNSTSSQYAELCENWADAQAQSRSEELEEARESRKQAYVHLTHHL